MRCLACASTDAERWAEARDVEYKSVPETFAYHRCRQCDALSIDPVPADRLSVIYPSSYYSFRPAQHGLVYRIKDRLDRRWFRAITRGLRGDSLSALDVGGGNGQQLTSLRDADRRIGRTVVVDFDADAEAAARAAGHEYVRGRIEDATVRGTFDVILLLNLIEHVSDPLAVLTKARALLAPTGVLVIKTPNYRSLDARIFRRRNWGGYHCPRHWVLFTRASFERVARAAGLRVVRAQYTQGAPFWTVSVLAWLDARGAARITTERPAWMHPLYAPLAALFAAIDFARGLAFPLSQMTFSLTRA